MNTIKLQALILKYRFVQLMECISFPYNKYRIKKRIKIEEELKDYFISFIKPCICQTKPLISINLNEGCIEIECSSCGCSQTYKGSLSTLYKGVELWNQHFGSSLIFNKCEICGKIINLENEKHYQYLEDSPIFCDECYENIQVNSINKEK